MRTVKATTERENGGVWQRTGVKTVHWNKLSVILAMKWRTQFSKNFISMPLFSVGLTFVMTLFYGSMAKSNGKALDDSVRAMALSLGALMNTTMTGILCTGMALAEEKEKHTLRALMTSSVNGLEFFLGSTIPVAAMILAVNVLSVPAAGLRPSAAGWAMWLGLSALCAIAATVLGMIFGICCKSQHDDLGSHTDTGDDSCLWGVQRFYGESQRFSFHGSALRSGSCPGRRYTPGGWLWDWCNRSGGIAGSTGVYPALSEEWV